MDESGHETLRRLRVEWCEIGILSVQNEIASAFAALTFQSINIEAAVHHERDGLQTILLRRADYGDRLIPAPLLTFREGKEAR
jgi:hypothetical protein